MSTLLTLRVSVLDAWEEVALSVAGDVSLADLKSQALSAVKVTQSPAEYLLKFRGAELPNEYESVSAAGLVSGSSLIVMPRRRRAVR